MNKERILVVDDEAHIRKLIIKSLIHENYIIEECSSSASALEKLKISTYDLIVLDVMLGDQDGFELLQEIRSIGIKTPVIFVSGRDEDHDKILGLGLGANNYIAKPFRPAVLCAHVKAQLRVYKDFKKQQSTPLRSIVQGPFTFDLKSYKLHKNHAFIDLSYKENQLIKFLMENPQQVFTKKQLYENIWDDFMIDENTIMVYMHHLRKKIEEDPKSPKHIVTVWGIGYKFMP